jgi:pilus assembly protein CpaC
MVFQVISPRTSLTMIESTSRVLETRGRISRVDGFDPDIIKITTLPNIANQIRVQAVSPGVTAITLVDEFDNTFHIDVDVSGDVRQLEAVIRRAFPDANVHAVKVKDSVLLLGWVNQMDQLTPIIEIAEQFHPKVLNYLKVGGVQQVMLKVKMMEVQRDKIRLLGFNFQALAKHGFVASTPGALTPLQDATLPFNGPPGVDINPKTLANTTAAFGVTSDSFSFLGFLEALKQENLLKILAEPNLVTVNGRPASFLSGGEFPILVPQSLGTLSVQYKEFGVRLEFVPFVLGGGRLRLDVAPEVSDRDPANSITLNGTTVPALTTRRTNTQVEMTFGETLIIAGLINKRITASSSAVPVLGEVPWLGAAFRRVNYDEQETELLIMVTPELVSGFAPGTGPFGGPGSTTTSPTDGELFGLGLLEVPKTGDECEGAFGNGPGLIGPGGMGANCNGPNCPAPNGMMAPNGALPGAIPPGGLSSGTLPPPGAQAVPGAIQNGPALAPTSSTEPLPAPLTKESPNSASMRPKNNRVVQAGAQQRMDMTPPSRRARPGLITPASGTTTAPAQRPVSAQP